MQVSAGFGLSWWFPTRMSKRPAIPSTDATGTPLVKRTRRQPGFRLARPAPVQPSSSSNSSLFVTVRQPDEQRGILQAQNRILSSIPDPSISTQDISPPSLSLEYDTPQDVEDVESNVEIQDKPKRKRYTTNAVSYIS